MRKWRRYGSRRPADGAFVWPSTGGEEGVAQTRRFAARFFTLCGLIALLAILAVGWWQRWPVHSIVVEGVRLLDTAQLRARLPKGDEAFSLEEWRRALLRDPFVQAASVYWEKPGGIRVVVREHTLVAVLQWQHQLWGLDEAGSLRQLPPGMRLPEDIPWLKGIPPTAEHARAVVQLVSRLPRESLIALSWQEGQGWVVHLRDGSVLLLGDTSAAEAQWQQWCRVSQVRGVGAPVVADLRWRGLVVVRPSVQRSEELPW